MLEVILYLLLFLQFGFLFILMPKLANSYFIDRTRFHLFNERRRLFKLAKSGEIDPSSRAFKLAWDHISTALRFTHKLSLLEYLASSNALKQEPDKIERIQDEWDAALRSLNRKQRKHLKEIRSSVALHLFMHLTKVSGLYFLVVLVSGTRKRSEKLRKIRTKVQKRYDMPDEDFVAYACS